MNLSSKQISLDKIKQNITDSDYILFSFSGLKSDDIKKLFLKLKKEHITPLHLKTSFLKMILPELNLKHSIYGIFFNKSAKLSISSALTQILHLSNYKQYVLNEKIQSDYTFEKGLTNIKPIQSYRILEDMAKVSIQKGYIFFNKEFRFLNKNELVNKRQLTILKDLNLHLKKILPEIKCIKHNDKSLTPLFISALNPIAFVDKLQITSVKYIIFNMAFINKVLYKIYT